MALGVLSALPAHAQQSRTARIDWQRLEPGLEWAEAETPIRPGWGKPLLAILRADPRRFRLRLVSATWAGDENRTARGWAQAQNLVAAINAGLFLKDHKTSAGLFIARGRVNNPRLNRWGAILAFDPRDRRQPPARIVDRRCENFTRIRRGYRSFLQSFRLLNCAGQPTMRQSDGRWSIAALATDGRGRILFLFAEAAFSTWEFTENMRRLPLGIRRAMYLEGSTDAQMYIRAGGRELSRAGRCSRLLGCTGGPVSPSLIPNVLGLQRIR